MEEEIRKLDKVYLTAEQLSRFGQLILDKGVWKGKRLIPKYKLIGS